MTKDFSHSTLGYIIGLDRENTIQYRGIKYASLDHQFAEPVLFSNKEKLTIDATSYGSACIQNPAARDLEFGFIQHTLPSEDSHFSGTECLSLNITTPKTDKRHLPVFIFIHGGGFSIGGNSWPHYDPTRLVEISMEKGTPVIGININYRLGLAGFLTSEELVRAGIKSNNGLRDQRTALTWIQKYVEGFGGDPENVTVVGESAGGASCLFLLESQQPLFKRLMSMGGTPLLVKPLPSHVAESIYAAVVDKLGLTAASSESRIKVFKEATVEELVAATSNFPLLPVIDGDVVTVPATYPQWSFQENLLPGTKWCESIMIGDCEMDSSILFYMLHDRLDKMNKDFISSTERSLDSTTRKELLEEYDVTHPGDSPDAAINNVLHFAHDIGFYAPVVAIASGWPGKSYVFHFNEPNPWGGRFQGVAGHVLDVAFLFQNYNEFLDETQQSSAKAFGSHFIDFVAGLEPFPVYTAGEGGAMVYGPGDEGQKFVKSKRNADYKRRDTIFKLAKISDFDKLSACWDTFMGGR
ncbi:Lipase [Lachnellula suecica]|uniref:Carboxylic ester hydrolase n=1 Tax=Lachnellula suecica TaxID=602035 RepID=A0A8T9C6D6_9HELO|nr:Lipase [Lachnellula suecica]